MTTRTTTPTLLLGFGLLAPAGAVDPGPWAEVRVVDAATGRGVPLVELETVDREGFVTDNAGRAAVGGPGLLGREVFLSVKSHGYAAAKDGFGFAGVKLALTPGSAHTVPVTRINVAERLGRLTGRGLYRDTLLLGLRAPLQESPSPGRVMGQDSIQAAEYKGKVYWFWGDTLRAGHPLGLYRTAGATTPPLPAPFDPAAGIPFAYFADDTGFARAVIPYPKEPTGVVWVDGVCTVPDDKGVERLVCHYSRREGLAKELEHGVALFDDGKQVFEPVKVWPLGERWRHPAGQATPREDGGRRWLLFGNPVPNVRVPAALTAVLDPSKYEAFTAAETADPKSAPKLGTDGRPVWRWQADLPPTGSPAEARWLKAGAVKPDHARMTPADAARPGDRVQLHNGTVRWNGYRKRWVLLAGQIGGKPSHLGEVWYAEAKDPTGPFGQAAKVVTHDRTTFYNVCHHPFLDRDGGRVVHFEGTYTADFSGNPVRTPRYEYNQILYRLALDAPALRPARVE